MKSLLKVMLFLVLVLGLASFVTAQAQLRWVPYGVVTHRTITALDGQLHPLATNSDWDVNPTGAKTARFLTNIVVRGTTALADDPVVTFRPYVRSGGLTGSVGGAVAVTYTRPRLQNLTSVKVQKTVDDGANYTDYSAEAIDDNAGTVVDLDSLDTEANGDWVIVGTSVPFMGVAWDSTTPNGNAATIVVDYWDGDSWEALANAVDGTSDAGDTFGLDGQMTWDLPYTTGVLLWAPSTIETIEAYWARIDVSAALDADTTLAEMDILLPIQASIDLDVQGDAAFLALESYSSVTGTIVLSGTVKLSWR